MLLKERWKDIVGYEGKYQVSNKGRVKSLPRLRRSRYGSICRVHGRIMKPDCAKGYLQVTLCKDAKRRVFKVARLVAVAFIPNPENKPEVNHKDTIKTNNVVSNLEWTTDGENTKHAYAMGVAKGIRGSHNARASFDKEQIRAIHLRLLLEVPKRHIARELGVCVETIHRISIGATYRDESASCLALANPAVRSCF